MSGFERVSWIQTLSWINHRGHFISWHKLIGVCSSLYRELLRILLERFLRGKFEEVWGSLKIFVNQYQNDRNKYWSFKVLNKDEFSFLAKASGRENVSKLNFFRVFNPHIPHPHPNLDEFPINYFARCEWSWTCELRRTPRHFNGPRCSPLSSPLLLTST